MALGEDPKNLFTSEPSYQNKSCSECQQDVRKSVCQYVRMQLFSLGIKMKIVQNVIRVSDSQYVSMSICQNATAILLYPISIFKIEMAPSRQETFNFELSVLELSLL